MTRSCAFLSQWRTRAAKRAGTPSRAPSTPKTPPYAAQYKALQREMFEAEVEDYSPPVKRRVSPDSVLEQEAAAPPPAEGNTTIDDTVRLFLRLLQERGQLRGAEEGVREQLMAVLGTSSSSGSTSAPAAQQQPVRSSTPLIATPLAWGKQILASPARLASRLFENDESPRVASPLASPSIALATPQATPAAAAQPFVRSYSPAPDLNLELADDDESEEDLPDWLLEASMRVAREEEETTAAATHAGLPGRMPTPPPPPSPPAKSPSSSILEPLESGLLWLTQATQSVTEQVLFFSTFGMIGGGTSSKAAAAHAPQLRPTSCARLGVDAYGVYS